MESKKNDIIDGKLKYDLFPIESRAVEEMVKVYMAGETNYVENLRNEFNCWKCKKEIML